MATFTSSASCAWTAHWASTKTSQLRRAKCVPSTTAHVGHASIPLTVCNALLATICNLPLLSPLTHKVESVWLVLFRHAFPATRQPPALSVSLPTT